MSTTSWTRLTAQNVYSTSETLRDAGEAGHADRLASLAPRFGPADSSPEAREFNAVVFGEFNRGKSTLINALLGAEVLPAKLVPTTGHETRLAAAAATGVAVLYKGGRRREIPVESLKNFSLYDGEARDAEVDRIEVGVGGGKLPEGLVLIDTPGVNDAAAQTAVAERALARADLVVLVLDATQLLGERDVQRARRFTEELGKAVVPVVNKLNLVPSDSDRKELLRRLDGWRGGDATLGKPYFLVNALGALKHAVVNGPAPADDFAALKTALLQMSGADRERLMRQSRLGQLACDAEAAAADNDAVIARLRHGADELRRRREVESGELKAALCRLRRGAAAARTSLADLKSPPVFTAACDALAADLATDPKSVLESRSQEKFNAALQKAAAKVDAMANEALSALAAEADARRPDPVTLAERLALDTRLSVGEVKGGWGIDVNEDAAGGTGMVVGGIVGTFLGPGIGTVIGAGIGGWLGLKFAELTRGTAPDYGAAYAAAARQAWAKVTAPIPDLLRGQFDARAAAMAAELEGHITALQARPAAGAELAAREAAAGQLRSLLDVARAGGAAGGGSGRDSPAKSPRLRTKWSAKRRMN